MSDVLIRLWNVSTELMGIFRKRTTEGVTLTITITVGNVTATIYESKGVPPPSVN